MNGRQGKLVLPALSKARALRWGALLPVLWLLAASPSFAGWGFSWGGWGWGQRSDVQYVDLQSAMQWNSYTPTPGSYAFGNVSTGSTRTKTFTLSNPGNDLLEAASLAAAGSGFTLASTTCGSNPFNVSSLGTCTATVQFAPVAATIYTGTLTASAPNLTDQVVNLSGTGISSYVNDFANSITCANGASTTIVANCTTANARGSVSDSSANMTVSGNALAVTKSNVSTLSYAQSPVLTLYQKRQLIFTVVPTSATGAGSSAEVALLRHNSTSSDAFGVWLRSNAGTYNGWRVSYNNQAGSTVNLDANYTFTAGHTYQVRLVVQHSATVSSADGAAHLYITDNGGAESADLLTSNTGLNTFKSGSDLLRIGLAGAGGNVTNTWTLDSVALGHL